MWDDAGGLRQPSGRRGAHLQRACIGYRIDPKNHVQLSHNAKGEQLFGEGYGKPARSADLNSAATVPRR